MAQRKTIDMSTVLRMGNHFLAERNTNPDEREAVAAFLEGMLCETGNYMGFRYLDAAQYPNETEGLGTRRYYYPSAAIQEQLEQIVKKGN
jgi:hypothetical protein